MEKNDFTTMMNIEKSSEGVLPPPVSNEKTQLPVTLASVTIPYFFYLVNRKFKEKIR